jgi:hypothetical protein
MPLFRCEHCNSVENTAVSNYWTRNMQPDLTSTTPRPALCSACDPKIGVWHKQFAQKSANGMIVGHDGFLYYESEFVKGMIYHTKPRGRIVGGCEIPI